LSQDVDLELVLCDGGSRDETRSIIDSFKDPRILFIDNHHSDGAENNWNTAISAASAPLVKIMGQDDVLLPGCLRAEISMLSQPDWHAAAFCYSRRLMILGGRMTGKVTSFTLSDCTSVKSEDLIKEIVRSGRNPIGEPVTVTMRRSALAAAGGFRGSYVIDLDLYVRLLKEGPAIRSSATLTAFRVSDSSWSFKLRRSQAREVLALHERIRVSRGENISSWAYFRGSLLARVYPHLRVFVTILFGVIGSVRSRITYVSRQAG
jgi:glycosyltransferase involved in cell wall biosynthesis